MNRKLTLYIILSIGLTAITILFYYWHFGSNGLSGKNEDWEAFAQFLAGITSPLLGVLNLIVLIRLTLTIAKIDNQRSLTELRFESYKEFTERLRLFDDQGHSIKAIEDLDRYLRNYGLFNFFLLDGLELKLFRNINLEFSTLIYRIKLNQEEMKRIIGGMNTGFNLHDDEALLRSQYEKSQQLHADYISIYQGLQVNYAHFLRSIVSHTSTKEYHATYLAENFDANNRITGMLKKVQ